MIISKVRTYIADTVTTYDNKYRQWTDAFNIENIPTSIKTKQFHIAFGPVDIDTVDLIQNETVLATVNFFFDSKKNSIDAYDNAIDTVNEIKNNLVNVANVQAFRTTDNYPIQGCVATTLNGDFVNSNDNSIVVTLELSLSVIEYTC